MPYQEANSSTLPTTKTVTSHAMVLQRRDNDGSMLIMGAVNGWNPSQTLALSDVFQLGAIPGPFDADSYGLPYEKVPGNVGSQSVSVTRYDLYEDLFEDAFATAQGRPLDELSNQVDPMEVQEVWRQPTPSLGDDNWGQRKYAVVYEGVWVSNVSRSYSASDQRIVNVNATFEYTRKRTESVD
jgi:hypothetical protein